MFTTSLSNIPLPHPHGHQTDAQGLQFKGERTGQGAEESAKERAVASARQLTQWRLLNRITVHFMDVSPGLEHSNSPCLTISTGQIADCTECRGWSQSASHLAGRSLHEGLNWEGRGGGGVVLGV